MSPGSFLTATGSGGIWEPMPGSEDLPWSEVADEVLRGWQRYFLEQAQVAFDAQARYGAFIILCALVHNLASHAQDGEINGDEFRAFVREYLPGYDAAALWDNFRCALFYRGVPGTPSTEKGVVLTALDSDHDPDGSRGRNEKSITIAFGKLHADLLNAGRKVLTEAKTDGDVERRVRFTHDYFRVVESEK